MIKPNNNVKLILWHTQKIKIGMIINLEEFHKGN
jgi:hypothetical protein